jgi:hypothetical protein
MLLTQVAIAMKRQMPAGMEKKTTMRIVAKLRLVLLLSAWELMVACGLQN